MDSPNFCFNHERGPVYGWFTSAGLCRLELPHADKGAVPRTIGYAESAETQGQTLAEALARYFSGMVESFEEIVLDLSAGTSFQRQVWDASRSVRWGQTSTYGELALRMGNPLSAARAVGHALGQNPVALLIPCHRFIGKDGKLHGFAAGLEWKRELLRLERSLLA